MKNHLTDRELKKLAKDAKEAKEPIDMMGDHDAKAFGARAQSTGTVSFILYRRFPAPRPSGARLAIGAARSRRMRASAAKRRQETGEGIQAGSVMSLPEARELARDWILRNQERPRSFPHGGAGSASQHVERERVRRVNTVESVLQSYFRVKGELRTIHKMEVTLRRELASWPLLLDLYISVDDVEDRINAIKPRGKSSARFVYALISSSLGRSSSANMGLSHRLACRSTPSPW